MPHPCVALCISHLLASGVAACVVVRWSLPSHMGRSGVDTGRLEDLCVGRMKNDKKQFSPPLVKTRSDSLP